MSVPKRRKKNRFKKQRKKGPGISALFGGFLKGMLLCSAYILAGAFFIFIYDCFTQSDYFDAREINVSGERTLQRGEIFHQAGISPGINVLSVNLDLVRKRLLAHPWIAEASVERELPGKLGITIKEHRPTAMADFNGSMFYINADMELFKEVAAGEPINLPVVKGLTPHNLPVFGALRNSSGDNKKWEAVAGILALGDKEDSPLPNKVVATVTVDRDMGVDLVPLENDRIPAVGRIRMGYGNYSKKYRRLGELFRYLEKSEGFAGLEFVDLNNINGIVARPCKEDSAVSSEKEELREG